MKKRNNKIVGFVAYQQKSSGLWYIVARIQTDEGLVESPVVSESWHRDYRYKISLTDGFNPSGGRVDAWLASMIGGYPAQDVLLTWRYDKLVAKLRGAEGEGLAADDPIPAILAKLNR